MTGIRRQPSCIYERKGKKNKNKAHQKHLPHHEQGRVGRVNAEHFLYEHN